jgi:hypothetical protein
MTSFEPTGAMNSFVATTREFPYEPKDLVVTLEHTYTEIAQAINFREIGSYTTVEVLTGKAYFDPNDYNNTRIAFRQVYIVGPIVAGATLNIPHNIAGTFTITLLEGTCITTVVDQRPIPYASATLVTDQISITLLGANIVIVNGATAPNITSGIVTLEYLYT